MCFLFTFTRKSCQAACGRWVLISTRSISSCSARLLTVHLNIKNTNFVIVNQQIYVEVVESITTRGHCEYTSFDVIPKRNKLLWLTAV